TTHLHLLFPYTTLFRSSNSFMRWLSYFILAYLMLGLQAGLAPYVRAGGAPPNFVLLTALFIALNAPRDASLLGCFGLGLMQDLRSEEHTSELQSRRDLV